jgi:aminoglycoside phosphotransferase (APT) family kinase protein
MIEPMFELTEATAMEYLRRHGHLDPADSAEVAELTGGISNVVLRVSMTHDPRRDFVVKQARGQLRTPDPWHCTVERIWREMAVLRICHRVVPRDFTPRILFEDRENYCFGMTAAPREHAVWKAQLLAGLCDESIAGNCGHLLGAIHRGTWQDPSVGQELGDRAIFDALRLDPYYRATARHRPESAPDMQRLINSLADHPRCLVHADFSPKNLLVFRDGMLMVDFETGHFGDPAFDLGFFLSHLTLKAFEKAPDHEPYLGLIGAFWRSYQQELEASVGQEEYAALVERGIQHLAGCAWARLDGTSKIDYLSREPRRDAVRALCRETLEVRPRRWIDFERLTRSALAALT